jgi:hypothetical protein
MDSHWWLPAIVGARRQRQPLTNRNTSDLRSRPVATKMHMSQSIICNLLAAIPRPPWAQPLDWDMVSNTDYEKRIFFSAYVKQPETKSSSPPSSTSFIHFQRLPAELQLRILAYCPVPTLWQLMRASSMLRTESSKLFWAHPDASFLVSLNWLLRGGYPGHTHNDLSFLRYAQNVEVEDDYVHDEHWRNPEVRLPFCAQDMGQGAVETIWTALMERCPKLKRVVFNRTLIYEEDVEDRVGVPRDLKALMQACPKGITVEAFVMEEREGLQGDNVECRRALYRALGNENWEELEPSSHRKAVLVPAKLFRGPVGQFEKDTYLLGRLIFQHVAFWPLVIEALDRHHFDDGRNSPFKCPRLDCDMRFVKAGEWTIHAATTTHGFAQVEDNLFDILPTELRHVFEDKYNQLHSKRQNLEKIYWKTFDDWNEEGGEKRAVMEKEFLLQLKNDEDWATGEQAAEHRIWKTFTTLMKSSQE